MSVGYKPGYLSTNGNIIATLNVLRHPALSSFAYYKLKTPIRCDRESCPTGAHPTTTSRPTYAGPAVACSDRRRARRRLHPPTERVCTKWFYITIQLVTLTDIVVVRACQTLAAPALPSCAAVGGAPVAVPDRPHRRSAATNRRRAPEAAVRGPIDSWANFAH